MSIHAVAGAPAPIQIGDKTYNASPLSLYALGALEEIVRTSILADAAKAGEKLPPALADRLIDRANDRARAVTFGSPDMRSFLSSFRGACAMIALSLRPLHPDAADEAKIGETLSARTEQCRPAVDTVMRISGLISDKADAKPGESGAKGGQPAGEAVAGA